MLILNRKPEQAIVIGDEITVKVIGVNGKIVRLGITAPAEVPVHRLEVYNEKKAEAT